MRRSASRLKLQPADPFDLIRWLARSQSDPRKAVAELVQNSIDAGARNVHIERRRLRGQAALIIRDDGEGVLPELDRAEALRHIATHIGHSRKLKLSPTERYERAIAGKYGVGLLGFWSIGRRMELRSRVGGSPLHVLELVEEQQTVSLQTQPVPLAAASTYTEVVVLELHDNAARVLTGRRLADYLAAELRGPILNTGVQIDLHDRMARGLAQKQFSVVPPRFEGERLAIDPEVPVEGYPPLRVELFLDRAAERPRIRVSCAGTLVADDIAELASLGLNEPPWVDRALDGIIEFPGFSVPPGTRRGVAPDAAAVAFVHALERLQPQVEAELSRFEGERRAAADRHIVHELKKALRGLREKLPHFDLPEVKVGTETETSGQPTGDALEPPTEPTSDLEPPSQDELFPPGPISFLRLTPTQVLVAAGGERRIRAVCTDVEGRVVREGIDYAWSIDGHGIAIRGTGPCPAVQARPEARLGPAGHVKVVASKDGTTLTASADVLVQELSDRPRPGGYGIPEPDLVDEPSGRWRSRFDGTSWQVNAAHEDYIDLSGEQRARVRYLVALLAKELAVRSTPIPGADDLLETVVAILAHAERNLTARPGA